MGLAPARSQLHQEAKSCRTFLGVRISPLGHSSGWRRMRRVWRGVCFLFVLFCCFFFLAVKDLNCAGSWVGGIERTCEGRGEQEPAEEGSSNANHRSASLPRSVCLSVSVLSCLKGGGLVP